MLSDCVSGESNWCIWLSTTGAGWAFPSVGSIVCFVSVGKVTGASGKALLVHAGLSLVLGVLLVCCVLSVCVTGESNWCSWQSKAPLVNRQLGVVPAILCTLSDGHSHRNGEECILTWRGTVEGRKQEEWTVVRLGVISVKGEKMNLHLDR